MRLYDILKQTSENGRVPYHMPGHKRNPAFDYLGGTAAIDFTEIDGLDNLHSPEGILRDTMDLAKELYGAKESFLLVNGSTCGILAAVYSACRGGKPLIAVRNAHKSVYNAALICTSPVHYLMPRLSEDGLVLDITPAEVQRAIEACPDAAAVLITSPTYDGVISDIAGIAEVCHAHGIPLIVDAAHGAHLGFLDEHIASPVECGADLVIMSLHKTLPSLTQTGLLHVAGELVDPETVMQALTIFETSSPSYLFMASIDGCLHEMKHPELFADWRKRLSRLYTEAHVWRRGGVHLRHPWQRPEEVFAFDESKLILSCDGYEGAELAGILRKQFGIEPEMTAQGYVLLMTGAGDTDEMTDRLCKAIRHLGKHPRPAVSRKFSASPYGVVPESAMLLSDALTAEAESVPLENACGRISAEFVMPYPPGIPLIAPGERITEERIASVMEGINVVTSRGAFDGTIHVVREKKH
ncbi:MAG: aminotransferase class V-fold PLP-dependent enzyme [Clostridia bacterium]|nr:aminotransferase class V-fold PLP-dependent enzyme [Clostridia bacterium]